MYIYANFGYIHNMYYTPAVAYIPEITAPDNAQSAETTRGSLQSSGGPIKVFIDRSI